MLLGVLFRVWFVAGLSTITISKSFASENPAWLETFPNGIYQSKQKREFNFFAGTPQGKTDRANPITCSARILEQVIQKTSSNPQEQTQAVHQFLERCGSILSRFSPTRLGAVLRTPHFSIKGRKDVVEAKFSLPFGVKVRGLLALKPSARPRPWIIYVCGAACDLGDSVARAPLSALFDEAPFDVLVLQSVSGKDFVRENKIFAAGGFQEGRQVYEIIRLLAGPDSPFRERISSFHIIGASLGGNGALFSSVYASVNPLNENLPKVQSVIGYCPVVDLKKSLEDLDRDTFTGRHYQKKLFKTTQEALLQSAHLYSQLQRKFQIQTNTALEYLKSWATPGFRDLIARPQFLLPPFREIDINQDSIFWDLNNFNNVASLVKIPTYVIASKDDFVVKTENNALALKRILSGETPITVLEEKRGWHCLMSEVFGTDIFSSLLRGLVLKNSPEFKRNQYSLKLDAIMDVKELRLNGDGEVYFGYNWSVEKNSSTAQLNFKVWTPNQKWENRNCSSWSPYYAFEGCFRTITANIPLKTFFKDTALDHSSKAGAEALTRWLNSHVHVLDSKDSEPVDSTEMPVTMNWVED